MCSLNKKVMYWCTFEKDNLCFKKICCVGSKWNWFLEYLEFWALTVALKLTFLFFWFGFHQGQSGACGFCIIAGGSLNTYCDSQLGVGETCSDLAAWKSNKSLSYPFSVVPFWWIVLLRFFFSSMSTIKETNVLRSGGIVQIIVITTKYKISHQKNLNK